MACKGCRGGGGGPFTACIAVGGGAFQLLSQLFATTDRALLAMLVPRIFSRYLQNVGIGHGNALQFFAVKINARFSLQRSNCKKAENIT